MAKGPRGLRAAMAGAQSFDTTGGEPVRGGDEYLLPADCPVEAIGVSGDVCYYLDPQRQLHEKAAKAHTRLEIDQLFSKAVGYLATGARGARTSWIRYDKQGNEQGWRPEMVASALMATAARAGIWNKADRERGRGAWRGEDGELILHTGDRVFTYPLDPDPIAKHASQPPGMIDRYVYAAAEPGGAPADAGNGQEAATELLYTLQSWQWRRDDLDAALLLGWIGAAMVGGALRWRPAIWVTGSSGAGKSTLHELVSLLLDRASLSVADSSAAGIWQTLKNQTLPVIMEELEAEEDNRRSASIIKLARVAASGGGLVRGGDKHIPSNFTLRSCFMFSSILIPPLPAQDRSRLAVLELERLAHGAKPPQLNPAHWRRIGALVRRRMVESWQRVDAMLLAYHEALAAQGHDARACEQFGALLACADVLLYDGAFSPATAAPWLDRMAASTLDETAHAPRDEELCLAWLMGAEVDPFRSGRRKSLGEWCNQALGRMPPGEGDTDEALKVLGSYGLRVVHERGGGEPELAIANTHRRLAELYQGSQWQGRASTQGVWTQSLRRLPGARRAPGPLYFGGVTARAVLIPAALVDTPDLQGRLELEPRAQS